jgi:CheY-like chemotaxis protein
MLLDLNMPMKNGFDVLSWVRSQPEFKRLSITILTASMRPEDVERAFDLGANSYLVKPSNLDALASMIRCLRDWIQINHFPPLNEAVTR